MVGDRLYTDMQLAQNAGTLSALVLTGEAKLEDLENSAIQPNLVCSDLAGLLELLKKAKQELEGS